LCEDEVRECLLLSESEQSLSDSKFDTENELDDHAFLDAVVNDGCNEDDRATQDFVWENMQNYEGQRENFTGSVGPEGAAKHVTESVDIFKLFFSKELIDTIVEETNRYAEQCLCGRELSVRLPARAWKFMLYWVCLWALSRNLFSGRILPPKE
jgi:hypothetical protein